MHSIVSVVLSGAQRTGLFPRAGAHALAALLVGVLLAGASGSAEAQTRAKRRRGGRAAATKTAPRAKPVPAPAPVAVPADSGLTELDPLEDPAPLQDGPAPGEPLPALPAAAAPLPSPAPRVAQDAPKSPGSGGTAREGGATQVPVSAPFTGPSESRFPPPSSLAGLDTADPSGSSDDFERTLQKAMSEAVVSTASKRDQRIADVPMTVSWIPGEEIEGTGQFTLCEVIQYFPGLECRRGSMRKAAVSARGLGSNYLSNRLLLLKNGRPLTDPWTGQFYADETTPLTNVKQIEVVRGPGSSLYGSNAFSGVINIIERQPADLMRNGRNWGVDTRVLAGQDNTYRLTTTAAGRAGPVEALVNYYGFGSDGPQLFNDPSTGLVDNNEDTRVHQVGTRVKAGPFQIDADFTDAKLGRPGGRQISTVGNCGRCHYTPDDEERVQNLNASAQYDQKLGDHVRVFAQAYTLFKRRAVDMRNMVTDELQATLGKRNRIGGEARALLSLGNTLNVTFGGDVKQDTVNNQNVLETLTQDDTHQTIVGAFVDGEWRPFRKLVLSGGARYDRYQIPINVWRTQTDQISPRASLVFHATEALSLRTNYGRAFRAPTLAELAINQQMYAATLRGNPNLRAETLDTVEAAVDFWPFQRTVRLTGTAFYNDARNFINQVTLGGSTSEFRNIGNARVAGFEAEAAAQVPSITSSFDVAYQFLDARSLTFEGRPEQQLDYAPHSRVYLRGRTAFGKVAFAEFYGLFVGARYDPGLLVDPNTGLTTSRVQLPSYITASARVGVNIIEGVSASLIGTNLFNARYEESHGFPAPPASLFGELKLRY